MVYVSGSAARTKIHESYNRPPSTSFIMMLVNIIEMNDGARYYKLDECRVAPLLAC